MTHELLQQTLSKTHDERGTLLTHLTYFQHGWSHIELVECTKLTSSVERTPFAKKVPCGHFTLATCEPLSRVGVRSHITCYIDLNC
jgi:hypothetical protein